MASYAEQLAAFADKRSTPSELSYAEQLAGAADFSKGGGKKIRDDFNLRSTEVTKNNTYVDNALEEGARRFDANLDYFDAAIESSRFNIFGDHEAAKLAAKTAKSKEELAGIFRQANGVRDFKEMWTEGASAGDWANYFVHSGLMIAPEVGLTIASAIASGGLVPAVYAGGRATLGLAAASIAKDKFVKRASQYAGAFAVNYPQRAGETYGFSGNADGSLALAVPQAAADIFAQVAVLKAFGKAAKKEGKQSARSALRDIAVATGQQAGIEGGTELFQTEMQILAKSLEDPNYDPFSDDAQFMRLEAGIAGTVLGGAMGGGSTAVGTVVSGGGEALTQFREGARNPETDFIPELPNRLQTQLLELDEGRGREAVVNTEGPLPPEYLGDRQQIELADGQGFLIVREDQDINEVKQAFESGSRDILGNGTVNKPEGGTEVVRSVNSDGSRGADVVVTPDTEAAVTEAQEAKSDIGQTEKVSAEQAAKERLKPDDEIMSENDPDFEEGLQKAVENFQEGQDTRAQFDPEAQNAAISNQDIADLNAQEDSNVRGVDYETAANFKVDDEPVREFGKNLQERGDVRDIAGDFEGYSTYEGALGGLEKMVKLAIDNARYSTREELTEQQINDLELDVRDRYEIKQQDDGSYTVLEYGEDSLLDATRLVRAAAGKTVVKGKKQRQRQVEAVRKVLNTLFETGEVPKLSGALRKQLAQVAAVVSPEGNVVVVDLKTLAERGWRELSRKGEIPPNVKDAQRLQLGLQESLGTLAASGYTFPTNDQFGGIDLSFNPNKQMGFGEKAVRLGSTAILNQYNRSTAQSYAESLGDPPRLKDFKTRAQWFGAARKFILQSRELQANEVETRQGNEFVVDETESTTAELGGESQAIAAAQAERAANQRQLNDSDIREMAEEGPRRPVADRFESIGLGSTPILPNVKTILNGNSNLIKGVAELLTDALKLTGQNMLIIDSVGIEKMLADPNLDSTVRAELQRAIDRNSIGKSIYPEGRNYGIVYVNTREINAKFIRRRATKSGPFANVEVNPQETASQSDRQVYEEDVAAQLGVDLNRPLPAEDSTQLSAADKAEMRALVSWVLMHEIGHQYFRNSINTMSQADFNSLWSIYSVDETKPWYESTYPNDRDKQFHEWLADRVAAYGMRQFDGQPNARDRSGDARADKWVAKIAQGLQKLFDVWKQKFLKRGTVIRGTNFAESKLFNDWLNEVLHRGVNEDPIDQQQRNEIIQTEIDEAYERFADFGEEHSTTRNQANWRRSVRDWHKAGVGSFMGRLFFSAHRQLRVLGPAGRRIANSMYKLSSSQGRDGFLQRALFQHQKWTGYLYRILPRDAETMTQVLDEYAVWKENGGDLQNIPEAIQPYYARLNTFFESMRDYLADADPNFRARENYFMHLYDPEKLNDPQKQAALARMLVEKQGYEEADAVAAVQGLRASLSRVNQSPDPDKVTAHSSETRAWTELTYADLKELNVLYDSRTAIFKYTKEVTRAAEFHKVFGDGVGQAYRADAKLQREYARLDPQEREQAQALVDGMLGRLGSKINPEWGQVQSWLMTMQFIATLQFATLASLPDILMPALRSREFSGLAMNLKTLAKLMTDAETREAMYEEARFLGTISNDVINESIISGYGSEWMDPNARYITDAFFKIIGLEHWTRMTRVVATSFGREFLIKHATENTPRGIRYLDELGIDGETVRQWINSGYDYNTADGRAVQMAILRFTDEAILRPNSAERPTYMSDPRFMLFGQLKGFYYSFGQKVVGGMYREMKSRQAAGEGLSAQTSVMILAGVALLPLAAAALAIREAIKYEEGRAPTDRMDTTEYMFELVSRAGFLGPLEIPLAMYNSSDFSQPFWVAPLGPTAGTAYDIVTDGPIDAMENLIPVYNQFN